MQRSILHSPLLDVFLKQYERDFRLPNDRAFEIPQILKNVCKLILVHDPNEPVSRPFTPRSTLFVEDVDKCLEYLNPVVRSETKGYFRRVDDETQRVMRDREFKSVLLCYFYLEGLWSAENYSKRVFFNRDGTIAENVPFMSFRDARVVVSDGKLEARVRYVVGHNKRLRDVVVFSTESDEEDGIYESSLLVIPHVDLTERRVVTDFPDEDGICVVNLRYVHDEEGFKVTESHSRKGNDGVRIEKKFVLDKPFRISIRYMTEEVLKIEVDALRG